MLEIGDISSKIIYRRITLGAAILTGLSLAMFQNPSQVSADESSKVVAKLHLNEAQIKAGSVLHMNIMLCNNSDKDLTIGYFAPFTCSPILLENRTGKSASYWAPPVDGPVHPTTMVLQANQENSFMSYELKVIDGKVEGKGAAELSALLRPSGWSVNSGTPRNSALISCVAGTYSVKFELPVNSVAGKSGSFIFPTNSCSFRIVQ